MFDDYTYQVEVTCPSCSSSPSCRRHEGCCLSREAMRMAELELQYGASPVATGQWETPVGLRPAAAAGRCTRCGGATWQHQARDICGQCGRITQHQTLEVRMASRRCVMP